MKLTTMMKCVCVFVCVFMKNGRRECEQMWHREWNNSHLKFNCVKFECSSNVHWLRATNSHTASDEWTTVRCCWVWLWWWWRWRWRRRWWRNVNPFIGSKWIWCADYIWNDPLTRALFLRSLPLALSLANSFEGCGELNEQRKIRHKKWATPTTTPTKRQNKNREREKKVKK